MDYSKFFRVVWEDDYLIVLDKSPQVLVVAAPRRREPVLADLVNEYLAPQKEKAYPAHRLDRTTSGLIIFAKSIFCQRNLMEQFRGRKVHKKYVAFVNGHPPERKGTLKGLIKKTPRAAAKLAVTKYRLMRKFSDFSILDIQPLTGRYNQIRIQLAQLGIPLVGERKYALGRQGLRFSRPALHSYFVQFRHPVGKSLIEVKIDLASDMCEFLKKTAELDKFVI